MHSAITPLLRFIGRNLLSLLVIAAVLVVGKLSLAELRSLKAARADAITLSDSNTSVLEYAQEASAAAGIRIAGYRGASLAVLDARISDVRAAQRAAVLAAGKPILSFPLPRGSDFVDRVVDHYKQRVLVELRQQELEYLLQLRAAATAGQKPQRQELEQLRLAHAEVYARYTANLHAWPWPWRRQALDEEHRQLLQENMRAYTNYQDKLRAITQMSTVSNGRGFVVDQARLDLVLAPLRTAVATAEAAVGKNWIGRLSQPLIDILPVALLVLLGSFLGHFLVKAFFYYVLAPLATRHRPICLDKRESGQLAPGVASAVSQTVRLAVDEQLLILPDYIQSSSMSSEKSTRWLLDWSCPWTSLISGMYGLTCIRGNGSEPIVVSAGADPLSEVALVTLPAGAAMVFQPRCLVGVTYRSATPLKITRHWRLGSAHAWLTLQLRYLIFHGPVTLIVRGTRGIRVEPAGEGRLISQSATLGFSASVDYSTVRCETFYPFYQGKTALLQDRFDGRAGYYVYDETPRAGKRSNFFERGLEGISDAALKVFGI